MASMFHILMLDFVTVNGSWRDKESNLGSDCMSGYHLPSYPKRGDNGGYRNL